MLCILVVTVLGFASKFYSGVGAHWANNSLAGLFYEIFWCLVVFLVFPGLKAWRIGIWVFCITSVLELLQLWHPVFLQNVRNTFAGAALLGNSFNWMDYPYYLAGCMLGAAIINFLKQRSAKKLNEIHQDAVKYKQQNNH